MNKQGQIEIPWLWITYLVLVGIIVGVFINYIGGQDKDKSIQEFYLEDITFLVNTIFSSEFKEEYTYGLPESFIFDITDKEIKIGLNGNFLSKPYIKNKNYKLSYEREGENLILRRENELST